MTAMRTGWCYPCCWKSHGFPPPSPQQLYPPSTPPVHAGMNVCYPSVIMSRFSPCSNRNHRSSFLVQVEFERGPDCVQGISVCC